MGFMVAVAEVNTHTHTEGHQNDEKEMEKRLNRNITGPDRRANIKWAGIISLKEPTSI